MSDEPRKVEVAGGLGGPTFLFFIIFWLGFAALESSIKDLTIAVREVAAAIEAHP